MRILLAVAIAVLAVPVFAADADSTPKISLKAQDMPLDQAMTELGRQTGARIVLDKGVTGAVSANINSLPLERALDVITVSNSLKWWRIYTTDDPSAEASLERIKAQVSLLPTLGRLSVAAYDPESKLQILFLRQLVGKDSPPPLSPETVGLKPFYLVAGPKALMEKPKGAAAGARDYAALQQERMQAFLKMSQQERQTAFRGELEQELALPDNVRTQLVRDRVAAIRSMDESLLREYMRAWNEAFHEMQGPDGGRPR